MSQPQNLCPRHLLMLVLTQRPEGNKHHLSVTNPSSEKGIAQMQQPQPHGTGLLGDLEATAALISTE